MLNAASGTWCYLCLLFSALYNTVNTTVDLMLGYIPRRSICIQFCRRSSVSTRAAKSSLWHEGLPSKHRPWGQHLSQHSEVCCKKEDELFSPPGNDSFRRRLMFYYRFFKTSVCQDICELHRPIATNFCTMVGRVFQFIMQIQNFRRPSIKNFRA